MGFPARMSSKEGCAGALGGLRTTTAFFIGSGCVSGLSVISGCSAGEVERHSREEVDSLKSKVESALLDTHGGAKTVDRTQALRAQPHRRAASGKRAHGLARLAMDPQRAQPLHAP